MAPQAIDAGDPVRWPWPAAVRAVAGAMSGLLVVTTLIPPREPPWGVWVAVGALALAFLAAPRAERWPGRGTTSGIALVTVAGIYLGPPETGQVLALALVLAVVWVADLSGRARVDGFIVALLDIVLVWAVLWGAANREGAVVAAGAMLGLLLVAPVVHVLPGPRRGLPRQLQGIALVLLQLLFVVGVARTSALWESAFSAAVVAGAALVALCVSARLIVGGDER